jgi:hypothetical protein
LTFYIFYGKMQFETNCEVFMAITIKSFGVALLAGLLAISSVASIPATAYAAPNQTHSKSKKLVVESPVETPADVPANNNGSEGTQVETAKSHDEAKSVPAPVQTVAAAETKKADPAGNNGTVKMDRVEFDSHPDNQPHVTCSFQVDFYGFDKGVGNADVNFELQPPTKDGRTLRVMSGDLTPNIGEDAASGGTDVDAQETYTLAFTGAPHSKQGYHVKLTVHAPGSQGADTKHKVFWVQPCAEQEQGHVLSTATVVGGNGGSVLPTALPSTGTNLVVSTIGTMLAATAAYAATLYREKLRKLF